MDVTLGCCTGGPGLLPAVAKSKKVAIFKWFFLHLGIRWQVDKKWSQTRENCLVSLCSKKTLATPSMGKHCKSARYGEKNNSSKYSVFGLQAIYLDQSHSAGFLSFQKAMANALGVVNIGGIFVVLLCGLAFAVLVSPMCLTPNSAHTLLKQCKIF